MANFLFQVSYTPEAWAAVINDPQDRSAAIRGPIEKLGGKIEHVWMAFGADDFVGVADMPNNVAAAALSMAISAGGACRNVKTTPLLSMSEGIEAMKKARECGYRAVTKGASA